MPRAVQHINHHASNGSIWLAQPQPSPLGAGRPIDLSPGLGFEIPA